MSFDTPLPPYNASDPHATFLSSSCLDLLLIELVPMAHRLARELSLSDDKLDDDEQRDAVFHRLETLGYRVGQGLAERCVASSDPPLPFSSDRPRFTDTLDVIKFLCKDLWTLVFRKQIDNLKTNHRGIYVLTDNTFRPFARMSTEAGGQAVNRAQPFLWFPCGTIRGALASMGIEATVHAETSELPGATFQIKTAGAKP
ncbi:MAG: Trafficking protein particle complex subunit 33 [Piccolia ochrophora]|nr:MAG: Trafficking protein particle complex subunit 33 [Piccolia ochrophora]